MADEEDGELMLRYARGDLHAFETLYQRHRAPLYRYLVRQTRRPQTADDLFQEVWSKLVASRARYQPSARFSAFLYRIAHNCFIDHCRRSSVRHETNSAEPDWENLLQAAEEQQPDRLAEQAQTTARYRAALATLPAEQRDVLLLYESGLSLEEISAINQVAPETVKSRLRYAVAKLRAALQPMQDQRQQAPASAQEPGL